MNGSITFDSNNLQTYTPATDVGIITNSIQHGSAPPIDMAVIALAHANKSVIPSQNQPSRSIKIAGAIKGSSQADLDSRIDAFQAYFNGKNKNLDIGYGSGTRRYIATKNTLALDRENTALFAKFVIEFVCTQPFGRNTAKTTALNASGRTLSGYVDNHTFLGSAPYQLPTVTITFAAVSGGASYVSWGNNANGQGITIPDQTWIAADVLEIDVENKTVKKNGVEIDFLGAFPEFAPGAQSFSYSDGFTSRTFTELVEYYPMFE